MSFIVLLSCKENSNQRYLPESTGGVNHLTVVTENELWNGSVGDKIRETFAAPALGLTWDEPQFTLTQLPPRVFTGAIRNSRDILYVSEDSVSVAQMKTDVYATPQKVGVIRGRDNAEIIKNLEEVGSSFIKEFKELELTEAQKRYLRSLNTEKALEQTFGITLNMPSVYKVSVQKDNFVWIDRQIQKGNMNIVVYAVPSDIFDNEDTFVQDIVKMRDSMGRLYIQGEDVPGKENYMVTEKAFSPYVFPVEIKGKKAAEVRGIWEMSGYPMAGPFLAYIINDKANNRKLVVEGFTFAPATEKRDYMFELEAILKSIDFDPKE